MRIDVSKFGTVLLSRPAGREAFLAARSYTIPKEGSEPIELDFTNVDVLAPSWADEFVSAIRSEFSAQRVKIIEGENVTVRGVFATLRELNPQIYG